MNKIAIALAATSALALTACSKKAPEELPPAPEQTATPTPGGFDQTGAPIPGSQAHFVQAMQGRDTIYFDTDMYDIDGEDRASLAQQAEYMRQYPNIRATVEGHCDERGTREYNLALGERRANAAKNYLISQGISGDRISTVSYGKERPAATGSSESAWARNRRAVTVVLN